MSEPIELVDLKPSTNKMVVIFVFDRSGSMIAIREEVVDAFNAQIIEIKKRSEETPTKVCYVTFSTNVDPPILWNVDADKMNLIRLDSYNPNGWTAMYDAVEYAIVEADKIPETQEKNTAVVVMILSDGEENHSKNCNAEKLASLIKEKEASGRWTFTYVGANQNLANLSKKLNISKGNMMQFEANAIGVVNSSKKMSRSLSGMYDAVAQGEYQTSAFYAKSEPPDNPNKD